MKPFFSKILFFLIMALSGNALFAQQTNSLEKITPAAYGNQYPLMVGTSKTTVLVFPYKITAVDLGSPDIIASTVIGVDNILRVKAVSENFAPTNATVITTDGKVYSFYVSFSDYPDDRPIDMAKQFNEATSRVMLKDRKLNDAQIREYARIITNQKPFIKKPHAQSHGIKMTLKGIYIKDDVLFFRLELKNNSPIDFSTDFARFYIRDQKRLKRTAEQETELVSLLSVPDEGNAVAPGTAQTIIVSFKRFTIADHKNLVMQLFEKDGDRHLELKVGGKKLLKARKPDR